MPVNDRAAECVPPDPSCLIESMRGIGYTLPSAIADLVDNSLTAGASKIEVILELTHQQPHLVIMDDGSGMTIDSLVSAMRMGTTGPGGDRGATDLGRFGLGMKTATLSQGRMVTVMTRTRADDEPSVRRWDLDHIRRTGEWQLLHGPGPLAEKWLERLASQPQGTVVVVECLDRCELPAGTLNQKASLLARSLEQVRGHLSVAFHRFIQEDGVEIKLGQSRIEGWDPFLTKRSHHKPLETLKLNGTAIPVQAFILPHHSRLSREEWELAAGPRGWTRHQGFYIYRCRRLIVAGTWLRLVSGQREQTKLARIRIDLPNTLDVPWQLNVMKVQVKAPSSLVHDLKRIADETCRDVLKVYGMRAESAAPAKPAPGVHPVWMRAENDDRIRYRINRSLPFLRAILDGGDLNREQVTVLLKIIESTIPVASILQDPAKNLDSVGKQDPEEIAELLEAARYTCDFYIRTGMDPEDAKTKVLSSPGFSEHRNQLADPIKADSPSPKELR